VRADDLNGRYREGAKLEFSLRDKRAGGVRGMVAIGTR
jgi:hypothetical protein